MIRVVRGRSEAAYPSRCSPACHSTDFTHNQQSESVLCVHPHAQLATPIETPTAIGWQSGSRPGLQAVGLDPSTMSIDDNTLHGSA